MQSLIQGALSVAHCSFPHRLDFLAAFWWPLFWVVVYLARIRPLWYPISMVDKAKSIAKASELALRLHGPDYFPHLERVRRHFLELAAMLPSGILTEEDVADGEQASLLHDIIEDGFITADELLAEGFSNRVLEIVLGLTRDPAKMTYHDKMVATAATDDIVLILAKLADNRDNSFPWRIAELPEERRSIIKRYRKARRVLFDGLATSLIARGVSAGEINTIEQWLGYEDKAPW
jgi:Guanosine polyphosphate pyrophosphohydrolases/synthetases